MDRRSVLKLFGITAAAVTVPAVVEALPERVPGTIPGPPDLKPPEGVTYNWKRVFITSEEADLENVLNMAANGWKPVPWGRHSDLLPSNHGAYWIEHGGLVLMEKPTKDIPAPKAFPLPWEETARPDGPVGFMD